MLLCCSSTLELSVVERSVRKLARDRLLNSLKFRKEGAILSLYADEALAVLGLNRWFAALCGVLGLLRCCRQGSSREGCAASQIKG